MLYCLCIRPVYKHAGHYLGYTDDLDQRLAQHISGRGSPLIKAALQAGCQVYLMWVREGDRNAERKLKNQGASRRHCQHCKPVYLESARVRMRRLREERRTHAAA